MNELMSTNKLIYLVLYRFKPTVMDSWQYFSCEPIGIFYTQPSETVDLSFVFFFELTFQIILLLTSKMNRDRILHSIHIWIFTYPKYFNAEECGKK